MEGGGGGGRETVRARLGVVEGGGGGCRETVWAGLGVVEGGSGREAFRAQLGVVENGGPLEEGYGFDGGGEEGLGLEVKGGDRSASFLSVDMKSGGCFIGCDRAFLGVDEEGGGGDDGVF